MDPFLKLFDGLPQQGPGSDASTRRALEMIPDLPSEPRILDIGCGPGRQTLELVRATGGHVTAVDLHQPFLDQLIARAESERLADRITTRCVSMDAIDDPEGTYDLIWAEGAAYLMGLETALAIWKPMLKTGGWIGLTELSWIQPQHPIPAMLFWADAYPAMVDVESNSDVFRQHGFEPLEPFALPTEDWRVNYYDLLEERIARLRPGADEELAEVLDVTEQEIELFDKYGDAYGYVFCVARRVG